MRFFILGVLAGIAGLSGAATAQCDTSTLEELAFQTNGVRLLGSYAQVRKRG